MKDKQFKDLEKLLTKLYNHLGHSYCIVPNYIHDGYSIGIYDKDGKLKEQTIQATLKMAADKLTDKELNR